MKIEPSELLSLGNEFQRIFGESSGKFIDMCFLFRERTENLDNESFLTNDVKDIIAKVLSVGDTTTTIQILDEEFFNKFEGHIYFAVSSLCNKSDDGYVINKVVRFEGRII